MSCFRILVTIATLAMASNAVQAANTAELIGKPMVGHTTDRSVRVWVRSSTEAEMVLVVSLSNGLTNPFRSEKVNLLRKTDWAGVAEVSGLTPNTVYYYDIILDGESQIERPLPSFKTFPLEDQPAAVKVLFGGGIRFQRDPVQRIWADMIDQCPTAFISIGDNVYPDPWNPILNESYFRDLDLGGNERLMEKQPFDNLREKRYYYARNTAGPLTAYTSSGKGYLFHRVYYRIQQSIPTQRRFVAGVPTYALWDDHDAYHDGTGGAHIPMHLRQESIQTFIENFANPYYGGGAEAPGTWCHFSLADLDFFLLDARTYRDYADQNERRFLGEVEENWLKNQLLQSSATFKFIVCGSPWNNQPKGSTELTEENYYDRFGDTLASFKWHRDELLKFIIENKIPGVVLLSGDRHRAEVVKVWSRGDEEHIFYDLSNCNIASSTHPSAGQIGLNGLMYVYSGYTFGVLGIDTIVEPPKITYSIWGTESKEEPARRVHQFVLYGTDFLPKPAE